MALAVERHAPLHVLEHVPHNKNNIIPFPLYDAVDKETKARLEIVETIHQIRWQLGIPPSFLGTLDEIIDALSSYSPGTHEGDLVINISNFNAIDNRARFLELESHLDKNSSPEEKAKVLQQKCDMLLTNVLSYLNEYVLFEQCSEYIFQRSDIDKQQMTMHGFEFTSLQDLCQKTVETFKKRGFKMSRVEIENKVYPVLLQMIVEKLPIGTEFFICSPPGTKAEGYIGKSFYFIGKKSYSFINAYKVILEPGTNKKTLVLHQYARWMTLEDHVEFIEKFGGFFDRTLALNDKNVILHPFFPKEEYTEAHIATYLERFKTRVPESHKEKIVDKAEFEKQVRFIFDHFYFPLFDQLAHQPLTQEVVEKMELAFGFMQRKLMHWIDQAELYQQQQTQIQAQPITMEDIDNHDKNKPGLKQLYRTQSEAVIDKTLIFSSQKEKDNHILSLSTQFGKNINQVIGAGQCYGSKLMSLQNGLKSINKLSGKTRLIQSIGEKEAKTWKEKGKCLVCAKWVDGDKTFLGPCGWCSNCDPRVSKPQSFWDNLINGNPSTRNYNEIPQTDIAQPSEASHFFTLLPGRRSLDPTKAIGNQKRTVGLNYFTSRLIA